MRKNQQIIIKSSKSRRINLLGLMNINLSLSYDTILGKVDSQILIDFFARISNNLKKKIVVICDRASIHTSDTIIERLEEWVDERLSVPIYFACYQ